MVRGSAVSIQCLLHYANNNYNEVTILTAPVPLFCVAPKANVV